MRLRTQDAQACDTPIELTFDPSPINFGDSTLLKVHIEPVLEGKTISFCPEDNQTLDSVQTDSDGDAQTNYTPINSGSLEITATNEDTGDGYLVCQWRRNP